MVRLTPRSDDPYVWDVWAISHYGENETHRTVETRIGYVRVEYWALHDEHGATVAVARLFLAFDPYDKPIGPQRETRIEAVDLVLASAQGLLPWRPGEV